MIKFLSGDSAGITGKAVPVAEGRLLFRNKTFIKTSFKTTSF